MNKSNSVPVMRVLALACLAAINSACTVLGPDYVRPAVPVPGAYKEAAGSNASGPRQGLPAGRWWTLYGDAQLDALIAQVEARNQSLQAVEARVRQAQALAEMARAKQSATVVAGGSNDLGVLASWEIDLWGRIRRNIEASGAAAQASAADLAALTLSLQAQLAQDYFQLRVRDAEIRLLQNSLAFYQRSLQIMRNQYAVGVVDRGNIAQAQVQLGAAQAQISDAQVARAQLEHAIALLVGRAPADLSLAAAPIDTDVPEVPSALPSELLQRRPDIAAAERRVAAASALIGVAEADFYPSLELSAGVSIRKGLLGGAKVALLLYPEILQQAARSKADAAYDEVVAAYRQTVLNSFREVEDNLAALTILNAAAESQRTAATAAREAMKITGNQYRAGLVNYQTLIVAQTAGLVNERAALDILGRRLIASVTLIRALGGGWETTVPATIENKQATAE